MKLKASTCLEKRQIGRTKQNRVSKRVCSIFGQQTRSNRSQQQQKGEEKKIKKKKKKRQKKKNSKIQTRKQALCELEHTSRCAIIRNASATDMLARKRSVFDWLERTNLTLSVSDAISVLLLLGLQRRAHLVRAVQEVCNGTMKACVSTATCADKPDCACVW